VIEGDLTAVISFIGVVVQLGGGLLLVLLFVLLRGYVVRRAYFAAWTAAWALGAAAIAALVVRYAIMPRVGAEADDGSLTVGALYLLYQFGKLGSFALFVSGTAMYATGSRLLAPRITVAGVMLVYSVASLIASDGTLNQLVVWQAPIAVVALGACGALLFTLPASRRTLGSMAGGVAFTGLALLWLVYGVAFGIAQPGSSAGWAAVILKYNTYLDLLLNVALGFAMVVILMEDAKREVDDAQGELRVAHDQLRRSALYDSLTDALNREAFAQGVGLEMARGTFGTVVIADLDNLKQVNDTFGHPAGDKLLRQCADLLRSTLRPYDKLYRWGGDEFLLILSSARSADVLARLTEIHANASALQFSEGGSVRLAVSLGASDYTSAEMIEDSIRLADAAMYRDKHRRKSPEHGFRTVPTPSGSVRIHL
jgi:diguanylate cyclase (GGDEF)-like protein